LSIVARDTYRDPALEWLDHVQPVGLVVAPAVLKDLILEPTPQSQIDSAEVDLLIDPDPAKPALPDPWAFAETILGWEARMVAGAPGGPALPDSLSLRLPEHDTTLSPDWVVGDPSGGEQPWQLLVRLEGPGVDPDQRGALGGWEATPHQRFERLLRETGVSAGLMIADKDIRLIYAPKGETSGWLAFPIRSLATVGGRAMLGGLRLMLDRGRLFTDAEDRRLPAVLRKSREAQAAVSAALAEQVLGALHELLRGLNTADPVAIQKLAAEQPGYLYEGLLTVLMRLVFVLYAEDRDLLPSRTDGRSRALYDNGYSVRGLYAKLVEDAALNPDTMDERRGGWGRLLALFRLIHGGHPSHIIQARGGKLFDADVFPFLEGRAAVADKPAVMTVSDGCILRMLEGLMTLEAKGRGADRARERLSYRTLDVEQIGSVYETVMGFTVEQATGRVLAIKAGKNNRTPVFVNLDALIAKSGKDRVKYLKEDGDRALTTAQARGVEVAKTVAEMVAALDSIVDERASPRKRELTAGTPILQPTDERRRTGSHYTPRSLTEPIVRYALEPAFGRLGLDAKPEQILDLKVCDPAMGSGAFLVEACRALAAKLVVAWARWPEKKPVIPADEDEELHARRLVAQRCLYGVDKNPLATDLAKLSLWLATLARDHEFTFLDHALKSGDSLVGLTEAQIAAVHWDTSKPGLPLFRQLVKERIVEAMKGRAEIQAAPDDTERAIQEARHRALEARVRDIRLMGDAVIAAFFSADKPKARETKRTEVESWLVGSLEAAWDKLAAMAASLKQGAHPLTPFHWEIEFPEVFARKNSGFDAIVGNPPFAGKNTIISGNRSGFLDWLQAMHSDAHGNSDLVAHFFRRAFNLIRQSGVLGLIATNTVGQGDTRRTGLEVILAGGGILIHVIRRLVWPGEAAVVVSVVHVSRGKSIEPILDGRSVRRISAYLIEGELDHSPDQLAANARKSFQGSIVLGMGFTFDDVAAAKQASSSLADMERLIKATPKNAERIFPYVGGEEINGDPRHQYRRYVIDFGDFPLCRKEMDTDWASMTAKQKVLCLREGIVPKDYPEPVAADWPELLEIVQRLVKPNRDKDKRAAYRERWWRFAERRSIVYESLRSLDAILVMSRVTPQFGIAMIGRNLVPAESIVVFAFDSFAPFCGLQARPHELWTRQFASSMKDDLRYTPSDCFETFPLPEGYESAAALASAGRVYHVHRAELMVARDEGMTKTYNRFHERTETAEDIQRLRELHAVMDRAVLHAYGWDDLAVRAEPIFLDETNEDDHTYQGRLFWPSDFRDEVLARLLALNAERHAEEVRLGIAPGKKGKKQDDDEEFGEE
jgi:N-6 DNA Methylase